jgi:hypothetical protein
LPALCPPKALQEPLAVEGTCERTCRGLNGVAGAPQSGKNQRGGRPQRHTNAFVTPHINGELERLRSAVHARLKGFSGRQLSDPHDLCIK